MKYQPIDDLRGQAVLADPKGAILSRRERLERWAELLEREPRRWLRALSRVEFTPVEDRAGLREDASPIAVAFADPVLRAAGLGGDTLGDAEDFFELSSEQAHQLLCDCHYCGRMDGGTVARRLRGMMDPPTARRLFGLFG
jgi:hypothetical protein